MIYVRKEAAMAEGPVLLLAPTGFVLRNLLSGEFVDAVLAERRLVIAVRRPSDERLLDAVRGRRITLIPFIEKAAYGPQSRVGRLSATYMYRFKQGTKARKSLEIQTRLWEPRHSLAGRAASRLFIETGRLLGALRLIGFIEDGYLRAIGRWPVTQEWCRLLDQWNPAAVISTMLTHSTMYHPSCDLPAVLAARQRGVPCGTLVQSWDNPSTKTAVLPPWIDRYWTWSESMTEELLALNPRLRRDRVSVTGSPQFDFHRRPATIEPRAAYVTALGLDPDRPLILIGTGTRKWLPNEPTTVVGLVRALAHATPGCQIVVRLHPKDDGARWAMYREDFRKLGATIQSTGPSVHPDLGGFMPPIQFCRDQISSLYHAAVVVNTSSTLTVDAALLDRPVICIGYDVVPDEMFPEGRAWAYSRSTHYAPLVATGGVSVVQSEAACINAIRGYLVDPSLHREGRQRIVRLVAGVADGNAGARLADEVLRLVRRACQHRQADAGQDRLAGSPITGPV